jgi:hypothetical protein
MHKEDYEAETKNRTGYQARLGAAQYPVETASWIKPYVQRHHSWNDEQHDASHNLTWFDETTSPSGYQIGPHSLVQNETVSADANTTADANATAEANSTANATADPKVTNSKILKENGFRRHAWTDDQEMHSHYEEFDAETKNSTGYLDHIKPALMQYKHGVWMTAEPTKSYLKPYDHSEHAWAADHQKHMNEKTWEAETGAPAGYQAALGAAQHPGETNSTIKPYVQRDHSWTDAQHDHSHSDTWAAETKKPSGYQIGPHSLVQGETNSYIAKYVPHDHAWTNDQAANYLEIDEHKSIHDLIGGLE